MLDTQGIFFLVLSICVLWLTAFLCWALWYAIKILRDSHGMMQMVKSRLERAWSIGEWLKSKLFAGGASAVAGIFGRALREKMKKRK